MNAVHNPRRVTTAQLGKGYRFLLKSEMGIEGNLVPEGVEYWSEWNKSWMPDGVYCIVDTFRVPIDTRKKIDPSNYATHHKLIMEAIDRAQTL